ncbi:hypothetical protein CQW23_04770 [Capsicum baccatum]|uniref:Calmodulin-binding domain-containing protein n=1 Tax=Capsicum baccatum TaxID=33114 RepID=A0A2G2XFN1_CAPBA|nr:hypothetical protein CQW23_04770 [Capsicum baccatum]
MQEADAGGKKDSVGNYRKQIIAPKVSREKSLKTPTLSSPPKSSSVKPLILRVRINKSLKLLAPLKDQNKMRRDGTNKLNPKMVPEKTLCTTKVKASPKSSSHLQSYPLSNEEDKKEIVNPADSALGKYTSSSKKLLHIVEAENVGKNKKKALRKGKTGVSNDNNSSTVKLKFRRGKIVDLQQETSSPRRLTFRWGRHVGESQDNNTSAFTLNWEIKLCKTTISFSLMEVVILTLNQWLCISGIVTSVLFTDFGGLEEIDLQATKLHEFECFFNNRVRFYFSPVPVLEHVKISLRGDASMPYIFGEFAANLPAQVKSLIVTAWNTQVTHFPTEMQICRNPRMLVLLFEITYNFDIVKVSPVLDAYPVLQYLQILCQGSRMMAEDNSDKPASPVTSVKNDSMDEDNTDELVSLVTSVKNDSMAEDNIDELVSLVTRVKNDSAGSKPDKINTIKPRSMSNGNKVLPYYCSSSSTSSYNASNTRRQSTGNLNAPDSRQDVIPHYLRSSTEQSPARTLVGEAKKGNLVKKKLSTPPGSVLGEKKKVIGVEQKPFTSPGSMLGEAKKRTGVMQKTSTTSRSNQSDAKKGILAKRKLSTPPVNMLEEGKKVNEVYQKPSSPQESVLKDEKEVTMVEQKSSSPPSCMEGGIDEGNKEVVVNQKPSAPPGSMLGQGKKLNVVDRRPSPKVHSLEPSKIKKKKILLTPKSVHSLKLDSSSDKMPETENKIKSSSKILEGVDAGGKKDSDQNKMQRDGTNKLNLEMVPEKTLRTRKVKASPNSSSHLQSRLLSKKKKKEVVKSADSALGKYTSSSKKLLHIAEVETVGKNQKKTLRKGKTGVSNDYNSSAVKLKFRRGKIVDLQQETSIPRRLTFRLGRHVGESQDNNIIKRIFKKKGFDGEKSNTIPISGKKNLRHQDVQEKKDVQGLLNNVIEETTSKLVETGKSKVKALVGAFETVISLHNKPSAVIVS